MTPEKQRIKIAEAHGWALNPECDFLGKAFPQCWTHDDYNMVFHDYELPDYLNDLNAMHEAEEVCIGTIHAKKHGQILQEVTGWHCVGIVPDHARDLTHLSKLSRATAAQRAESFLRTLNLWES